MKCLTSLPFLLWLAPLVALPASNNSFRGNIQIEGAFCIKADRYKVHIRGMHPGRQNGEMEVNGEPIDGTTIQSYLIRWHHAPSLHFEKDPDKDDREQSGYDRQGIFGFTGKGLTLAFQLLLARDFQQLRIGGGVGIRCSFFKEMVGQWVNSRQWDDGQNNESYPLSYIPLRSYYFTWTPLFRLGFKLIENQNYTLLIDGTWAPSIYHFSELGRNSFWIYARNGDVGGTWEKPLTRYLNWSLRTAYSFCLNNERVEAYEPSSPDHLFHVSHYIDGIIAQVGISIRIPKLSKCPIVGCRSKREHIHGGKYYRGDSLFTSLY